MPVSLPFTSTCTSRSRLRNSLNFPNRTWNGVLLMVPSSFCTAMMSSAPDSVALLKSSAADTMEPSLLKMPPAGVAILWRRRGERGGALAHPLFGRAAGSTRGRAAVGRAVR